MNKDTKIFIALLGTAVIAALIFKATRQKDVPVVSGGNPEPAPTPSPTNSQTPQPAPAPTPAALNRDLVLKVGSAGAEVKQLQSLLKVTVDGAFGAKTEAALYARKGVKQVSLNGYAKLNDVPKDLLKVGNSVMAAHNGVQTFENKTIANGYYSNTHELADTYAFGDRLGEILSISTGKQFYVVKESKLFGSIVWVAVNDVTKI